MNVPFFCGAVQPLNDLKIEEIRPFLLCMIIKDIYDAFLCLIEVTCPSIDSVCNSGVSKNSLALVGHSNCLTNFLCK